jgi:hypothetical protein
MRKCFFILVCLFASNYLLAQGRDQLEVSRAVLQAEKKALIAAHLKLTDDQSQEFWPVYNEYALELGELNTDYLQLLSEMAEQHAMLSEERADEMLKRMFTLQLDQAKLHNKYRRKFDRVLPAEKLNRFYQLEHSLDIIIDYDVAQVIPLVE